MITTITFLYLLNKMDNFLYPHLMVSESVLSIKVALKTIAISVGMLNNLMLF